MESPRPESLKLPMFLSSKRECLGLVRLSVLKESETFEASEDPSSWPQYILHIAMELVDHDNYVLQANPVSGHGYEVRCSLANAKLGVNDKCFLELRPSDRNPTVWCIWTPNVDTVIDWQLTLEKIIALATQRDKLFQMDVKVEEQQSQDVEA